ncbi:MAG: nucleoside-diphosphate kinase [Candidatus Cloacimonadota bacterium]|nr:MAG: nucleoside-diphosphate kinase [Candidatus Cloacimonadota bacterium]PIE78323.1 MAG: nucleoside-diphosphate kinase [Candidatus Delongbacteria bacterium]
MKNKSLLLIKPLAFKNKKAGKIISMIEEGGFDIVALKQLNLTEDIAKKFYAIHKERPFFGDLVKFMTSGKIVAICVEKENCVEDLRKLVGNTDPAKADDGTIREAVGTNIEANGVHASDSEENAINEIRFFFSAFEVLL